MEKNSLKNVSNITGGSNIYPCNGMPSKDEMFVNHIEAYSYIKDISRKQSLGQTNVRLLKKQAQFLNIEMRCLYAKNDPCWGYVEGQGIKCKCINIECPKIGECNPTYTHEQRVYWTMKASEKKLYGEPNKLKKYYLVDLVSDDEKNKYISYPKGAGKEFPPIKEIKIEKKPKRGRSRIIIGYEKTYFGDADDQLSPIWGYVDDVENDTAYCRTMFGKSQKVIVENEKTYIDELSKSTEPKSVYKHGILNVNRKSVSLESDGQYKKIEELVKNNIVKKNNLTELLKRQSENIGQLNNANIVLSNKAEVAYVSKMLIEAGILQDLNHENNIVRLWDSQNSKAENIYGCVFVSNTFISYGCHKENESVWKKLEKINDIIQLNLSGRSYFNFKVDGEHVRWGYENLYGATHLLVEKDDLIINKILENRLIGITIEFVNGKYDIYSKQNGEKIGYGTDNLIRTIEKLKKLDKIIDLPKSIDGVYISKVNNTYDIYGLGHMKFDEY